MKPVSSNATITPLYLDYLNELSYLSFDGEICTDYATRLTLATDNSVYQVIPEAVLFPRSTQSVSVAMQLANKEKFHSIKFSPRGGGTGTNGQSLTTGIMIDCSKYLTNILEINTTEKWVRVQAGVVLDQLNALLHARGFYFAPEISPSNRATIGGMVNTDACGNGSKVVGRTSDHVLDLTCILANGKTIHSTTPLVFKAELIDLLSAHKDEINHRFGNMPRSLNGYNLKKAYRENLNLNYLLCGSEGTLGIITECKLKILPLPKFKKLIIVKYKNFSDALNADEIKNTNPRVIETIDAKLLELARQDLNYLTLKNFIEDATCINLVEFVSDDEITITNQVNQLCENVNNSKVAVGFYVAKDSTEIELIWGLRKKSVGLISRAKQDSRRPIPFIEDTAVPPSELPNYIREFTALLDRHNLVYGMYGHVDAGCIHVRPALDLRLEQDQTLLQQLSDEVVALVQKYKGVMWGEHGKGYRSTYNEAFFGPVLFKVLRQIKTFFDPHNQLNPGKIATPLNSNETIVKLTSNLRADSDKHIRTSNKKAYQKATDCNGNAACFTYKTTDVICPSYKVTKNRIHSPKGRAVLVREWLRLQSISNTKLRNKKDDFSHVVLNALSGCLGCKACATQCPLSIDIPATKAEFLNDYYKIYHRPLRDKLISRAEKIAYAQVFIPFFNTLIANPLSRWISKKFLKLIDLPVTSQSIWKPWWLDKKDVQLRNTFSLSESKKNLEEKSKPLILLLDVFSGFYDPKSFAACYQFFRVLGYSIHIPPFFQSGKPLHVKGYLHKFKKVAEKNILKLKKFTAQNIPIVGVDPSTTLVYRDEYQYFLKEKVNVLLPQEFLIQHLEQLPKLTNDGPYFLISHCTEKTALVDSEKQWQAIFAACGLTLNILPAGCCGMAGSYGHELEHYQNSKTLFEMDWLAHIKEYTPNKVLTTGYSCRSQAMRLFGSRLKHPLEVLIDHSVKLI